MESNGCLGPHAAIQASELILSAMPCCAALRHAAPAALQEIKLAAAKGELQALVEGGGQVSVDDYQQHSEEVGALTLDSPGGWCWEEWDVGWPWAID